MGAKGACAVHVQRSLHGMRLLPCCRITLARESATAADHGDMFKKLGAGAHTVAAVRQLLLLGADTTLTSKTGLTPLVVAACANNSVAAGVILKDRLAYDETAADRKQAVDRVLARHAAAAAAAAATAAAGNNESSTDGGSGAASHAASSAAPGSSGGDGAAGSTAPDSSSSSRPVVTSRLVEETSVNNKVDTLPLHKAVQFGHLQSVEVLLAGGADPNHRCCHGYSPLLQVTGRCSSGSWFPSSIQVVVSSEVLTTYVSLALAETCSAAFMCAVQQLLVYM